MTKDHDHKTSNMQAAWQALRYFNLYRLILAGLAVVLTSAHSLPPPLGAYDPLLFNTSAIGYLILAVFAQVAAEYSLFRHSAQVLCQVLLDIGLITAMMYASGGVSSGIGVLLVVSIAGGSILRAGRTAGLFAALASLAILSQELYLASDLDLPFRSYTHAGLLGATCFATAFLGRILASRTRQSEALAAQRGVDLANLARLNEHIVQRMQSGILVLDERRRVRLANGSAVDRLGLAGPCEDKVIADIAPELDEQLGAWLQGERPATSMVRPASRKTDIQASFTELGPDASAGTLIFLEDAAVLRQRAQQLKLASLGRLTGSIAHEIRNPLGAISHAAQLLFESPHLTAADQRLTRIIKEHSARVNRIIENVMRIGRRDNAVPESFTIKPWLESFVEDLCTDKKLEPHLIALDVRSDHIRVRMDRSQLHQVLWNLCENGLRYSKGNPLLRLGCGIGDGSRRPYLDVIDHGPGIPKHIADQIFEPFFTNDSKGTGLGLYIASELCECNQALLGLYANTSEGCCFRISFAHPDRQQLTA